MDTKTLKETHEDVPPNFYDKAVKTNLIQHVWHARRFRWISGPVSEVDGRILDIGCDGATLTEIVAKKSGTEESTRRGSIQNFSWPSDTRRNCRFATSPSI